MSTSFLSYLLIFSSISSSCHLFHFACRLFGGAWALAVTAKLPPCKKQERADQHHPEPMHLVVAVVFWS